MFKLKKPTKLSAFFIAFYDKCHYFIDTYTPKLINVCDYSLSKMCLDRSKKKLRICEKMEGK
jgi:hypothetical protein